MEKIKKAKADSLKRLCGAMGGTLESNSCVFQEPSPKNVDLRDVQFVMRKIGEI